MPVEKQREVGSHLAEEGRHIVVVIVDPIVDHSEPSSEAIASQIYEMHIKTVQSVLNCTF